MGFVCVCMFLVVFLFIYCLPVSLFSKERKRKEMELHERGVGENPGGVGREESVTRIYCTNFFQVKEEMTLIMLGVLSISYDSILYIQNKPIR